MVSAKDIIPYDQPQGKTFLNLALAGILQVFVFWMIVFFAGWLASGFDDPFIPSFVDNSEEGLTLATFVAFNVVVGLIIGFAAYFSQDRHVLKR